MSIASSKARSQADRLFLLLALAQEKEVRALLGDYRDAVIAAVIKYSNDNGLIIDQRKLNAAIDKATRTFTKAYADVLTSYGAQVAAIPANEALKYAETLRRAKLINEASKLTRDANEIPTRMAKNMLNAKWASDRRMLSVRIKTVEQSSVKTVRNIIYNMQKSGKGAQEIAKAIEQYIIPAPGQPTTAPYNQFRARYGRPANYVPKNVRSGSVQYNALRIARTETAHMYRQSTIEFYKDKPYVNGFRWLISGSHARQDDCDAYAAVFYKDWSEIPGSHPNCLCRVVPDVMTAEQLRNYRSNV